MKGDFVPKIHRYEATYGNFFVNAFLVELENSVVAIDSAIANCDVKNIRDILKNKINKKLEAVILTHGHPDHYTGAGELIKGYGDIPIYATEGTLKQCHSRDEEEGKYLGSDEAFGPEYPEQRVFPNNIIEDGAVLEFDNLSLKAIDLGGCESDDDVLWVTDIAGQEHVFSGDIVYNKMHTFFADGHVLNWLDKLDYCIEKYNHNTIFHTGHGDDMGIEVFYWQKGYIEAFLRILRELTAGKDNIDDNGLNILFKKMKSYLPNDKLIFLTMWNFDQVVKGLKEIGAI